MRDGLPDQLRCVRSVDPDESAARPVADRRIRGRLEREHAVEGIRRREARLHVEVTPDRCFGTGLSDGHACGEQQPPVGVSTHFESSGAAEDRDPVRDRSHVDVLCVHPPPLPVRSTRQAEPIPRTAVVRAANAEREHDAGAVVGPELRQPSDDRRVRIRRGADDRAQRRQLAGGRKGRRRCDVRRTRGGRDLQHRDDQSEAERGTQPLQRIRLRGSPPRRLSACCRAPSRYARGRCL